MSRGRNESSFNLYLLKWITADCTRIKMCHHHCIIKTFEELYCDVASILVKNANSFVERKIVIISDAGEELY